MGLPLSVKEELVKLQRQVSKAISGSDATEQVLSGSDAHSKRSIRLVRFNHDCLMHIYSTCLNFN